MTESQHKIFISWSKDHSKKIALALKKELEEIIFAECNLSAFVSDTDIVSGSDWYQSIKDELLGSQLGIVCITKENFDSPWLYFESGALVANNLKVVPLLFCNARLNDGNPLRSKHSQPYNEEKFTQLIKDINKIFSFGKKEDQITTLAKSSFSNLNGKLKGTFAALEDTLPFSISFVYPKGVRTVTKDSVYISVPMASCDDESQYAILHNQAKNVVCTLDEIGFKSERITCPAAKITTKKDFDGSTMAFSEIFKVLKSVDDYVLIYPYKCTSSVLVELGYAIALTKNIVIFTKKRAALPFIVQEPNSASNMKIYEYADDENLISTIRNNGKALFEAQEKEEA